VEFLHTLRLNGVARFSSLESPGAWREGLSPFCSERAKGTQSPRATEQRKERRKHVRYPVRLPVFFSWKKRGSAVIACEGITRDISLRGAYVLSANCLPVDTVIEMEILLPRSLRKPNLLIVGKVRIQRVERASRKKLGTGFSAVASGFAVRTSSRWLTAIVKPEAPSEQENTKDFDN
jgi:hypothetical protein